MREHWDRRTVKQREVVDVGATNRTTAVVVDKSIRITYDKQALPRSAADVQERGRGR